MNKDLMQCTSHCKFCGELAEDCTCDRGKSKKFLDLKNKPRTTDSLEVYNTKIEQLILDCKEQKSLIPLPYNAVPFSIDILNKELDCSNCDSDCCRKNMSLEERTEENHIALLDSEVANIHSTLNHAQWECFRSSITEVTLKTLHGYTMSFPCIFLREDSKCAIYNVRPLVCRIFPFLFMEGKAKGESIRILGINYNCPESSRLVRLAYTKYFDFAHNKEEKLQ